LGDKADDRSNPLTVLVVREASQERADICSALTELSEPELEIAQAEPESAGKFDHGVDVAIVVVESSEDASLEFIQSHAQRAPRPALFALLRDRSSDLMRRALRAGADEMLFLPLNRNDAVRALLKIAEARRREERPGQGQVCSIVSITGGVGVTTLAANFAIGLRGSGQRQVAIADLDFQSNDLSSLLNLEPDKNITALAESRKELDSIQLEAALCKHSSGIYLLPGPKRIEDAEMIGPGHVAAAVDLMRQLFEFVVIDCGRNIDESTIAIWQRSDHLFYVLDQPRAALSGAARFFDLFERLKLNGAEPSLVLNRYQARNPISEGLIAETLERPIHAIIARDDKACEQAIARGQDLGKAAPNSPLTKSIEDLVRRTAGALEPADERGGGLLARLFTKSARAKSDRSADAQGRDFSRRNGVHRHAPNAANGIQT